MRHPVDRAHRLAQVGRRLLGVEGGDQHAAGRRRGGEAPAQLEQDGDAAVVVIALPFADRAELEIAMSDGELIVTYGPYRRCIALPDSLRSAHVVSARLADDELRVELAHS